MGVGIATLAFVVAVVLFASTRPSAAAPHQSGTTLSGEDASLLEALGTFRFLLTELVPLQLILENRGLAAPAEEEEPTPPASPGPPEEIPF